MYGFVLFALECVLDLIPETLALGLVFIGGGSFKVAQQMLLMVGQMGGNLDVDTHILIAASASVDVLNTLAAQAEDRAGLGALGDGVFDLAVDGRHL